MLLHYAHTESKMKFAIRANNGAEVEVKVIATTEATFSSLAFNCCEALSVAMLVSIDSVGFANLMLGLLVGYVAAS